MLNGFLRFLLHGPILRDWRILSRDSILLPVTMWILFSGLGAVGFPFDECGGDGRLRYKYLELMRRKFWYKTKLDAEMFPRANTVIFTTNMLGV